MNTISAELTAFGFENASHIRLSQELGEAAPSKLNNLFSTLWTDKSVLTDNDRVNRMIIRYAIIEAINAGADNLTDEIITLAKEKAGVLAGTLGTYKIEEPEMVDEDDNEVPAAAGKRTRNPDLYPRIKSLVGQYPEALKDEIVATVLDELDTNEGTATMYYYKARKELGLKNNGKRGRKPKESSDA